MLIVNNCRRVPFVTAPWAASTIPESIRTTSENKITVALIGNTSVGKTTLADTLQHRFIHSDFKADSTIGLACSQGTVRLESESGESRQVLKNYKTSSPT